MLQILRTRDMNATNGIKSDSPRPPRAAATRFVMLGGFFGAGKTTLALRLAKQLKASGQTVAYLANDHGSEAMDAGFVAAHGIPTERVTGGSLGRAFDSLAGVAGKLREEIQPDVIIAEPVGSGADLVATVSNPLLRLHKSDYTAAPFSVVVDPQVARRAFAGEMSEKIFYLYRKQLEEADHIILNKIDLLSKTELESMQTLLRLEFPQARIFELSAKTGAGLGPWSNVVMTDEITQRAAFEIDSHQYATAESAIASLTCTVQVSARRGFQCNPILRELARGIQRRLSTDRIELAHLKISLRPEVDVDGVATLNLLGTELDPIVGEELAEPVERGSLSLSLRALCKPDVLNAIVTDALTHLWAIFPEVFARVGHMEHFRPSAVSSSRP